MVPNRPARSLRRASLLAFFCGAAALLSAAPAAVLVPPPAGVYAALALAALGLFFFDRRSRLLSGILGEEAVASVLSALPYRAAHDLRLFGFQVDHLVSVPGGLVLIETKRWRGSVLPLADPAVWLLNGRPVPSPVALAEKKARVLSSRLRVPVKSLVVMASDNPPPVPSVIGLSSLSAALASCSVPGASAPDLRVLLWRSRPVML